MFGTLYDQYTCHIKIEAQSEKKIIFCHPRGSARVAVGGWWVVVFKVDKTLLISDVSVQNHRPLLSYSFEESESAIMPIS